MPDRRAGPRQGPYVRSRGGGIQPRARNQDGSWRRKGTRAGKVHDPQSEQAIGWVLLAVAIGAGAFLLRAASRGLGGR